MPSGRERNFEQSLMSSAFRQVTIGSQSGSTSRLWQCSSLKDSSVLIDP